MNEIAKIYITDDGRAYRIKVFPNAIGIECQQPHGDNRFYDRTEPPIYNGHAWNLQAIGSLIAEYDRDQHDQVAHDLIAQLDKLKVGTVKRTIEEMDAQAGDEFGLDKMDFG